ncbi:MaoC like domain protein [compost metagenome]|uniref:MaoC family dehydratase n=1 Tax=Polaromonas aquatica TaxID=332657 RepID=A0ABW1TR29_9BURK
MTPIDQDIAKVSRRAIVQYAGIVQDFNPVHYDDEFARKSGLPGAIAQGPLTLTLVLDALVAKHGADNIAGIKTRLKAPVVPADQLHLAVDAQGNLSARVEGKEVLSGTVQLKD